MSGLEHRRTRRNHRYQKRSDSRSIWS